MKKTVLVLMTFCITIICSANSIQDSIIAPQFSQEVVEKLSNEELIQLIKDVEYIRKQDGQSFTNDPNDKKNFVFQHLSNRTFVKGLIISLMIFIILLISIPFYFNFRKTKSFHRLIENFINKDKEIPSNIILSTYQTKSDIQKSIILIATGIGLSIVLLLLGIGGRIWSIGLIPIIIGFGYFIASRLENKS
jgi:hypothetical protein